MVTRAFFLGLVLAVAAERLLELRLARANTAWALAHGGIVVDRHFHWMKALHTAFLVACALEVLLLRRPFVPLLAAVMLPLLVAAQALRYWAVRSLGHRWNLRVVVLPGRPACVGGPYRWLRHPNYLAVVIEGFALPLVHAAWLTAAGFTLLDALVLRIRIHCEERALSELCDYQARLGGLPRFVPGATAAAPPPGPVQGGNG